MNKDDQRRPLDEIFDKKYKLLLILNSTRIQINKNHQQFNYV